jgi:hypothetical protein
MPRVNESITPPQAGCTIAGPGIEAGAPVPSAPIPYDPPNYREGAPASAGPANYLTGGFLELDPGPPSKKASGEGSWNGSGGAITPLPGPLGDASIRAELEHGYHMPSGSEGQDFASSQCGPSLEEERPQPHEVGKVHGGDAHVVQPRFDNRPGQRLFDFRGYLPPGSRG